MKFKMKVQTIGSKMEPWWEDMDEDTDDAQQYAKETIEYFNRTLRPSEQPRELLEVVVLDKSDSAMDHDWRKTNAVTIMEHEQSYDTYQCSRCKITGKRLGLGLDVTRDPKYSDPAFKECFLPEIKKECPKCGELIVMIRTGDGRFLRKERRRNYNYIPKEHNCG